MNYLKDLDFEDIIINYMVLNEDYKGLDYDTISDIAYIIADKVSRDYEMNRTIYKEINDTIDYYVAEYRKVGK